MKQFAVAFTTTGNSPKDGHRFSEMVLVGQENGKPNGQGARFKFAGNADTNDGIEFPAALAAIKTLVGDADVVVHNSGNWRRFLRAELRNIKRHGAANLMDRVIDVNGWAHQRFPRQRKDVTAIARHAGIEIPANLNGLDLEAELLRRIAKLMTPPAILPDVALDKDKGEPSQTTRSNLFERIGNFWRCLRGHA